MTKTLIVGTGRSGTGWCAQVLNQAGLKCGHQSVFKHEHTLTGTLPGWGDYDADSSYEAVPMLPQVYPNVYVILVVRHPLQVIRSWLEHGAFRDDMPTRFGQFTQVLRDRFPSVLEQDTPVDRAATYWLKWNLAAQDSADAIAKLEGLTPRVLADLAGQQIDDYDASPVDPSRADKRLRNIAAVGWKSIGRSTRRTVRGYAIETFGYE